MALRPIPIPKQADVHRPGDLANVANGDIANIELGPCGVFSFYEPHGELKMHHLAADGMRAMAKALCADLKLAREAFQAENSVRTLQRQIQMFDGTIPKNRTEHEGRYIPEPLWDTMPAGSLEVTGTRSWKNMTWRRRKGTAEAASPGESNHGFGLAIDIVITNQTFEWMVDNALRFGFSGETPSERNHWRYIAGDNIPPALAGGTEPIIPGRREPRPTIEEDDDMKIIDLAAGTPQFTRLIISGRIKWVRGPAAAALDRMTIEREDVSADELGSLIATFRTEGESPFGTTRAPDAANPDLHRQWQDALA
jgi:hypothetical protein